MGFWVGGYGVEPCAVATQGVGGWRVGPGGSSGLGEFVVDWPLRYFLVSLALSVRTLECHLPPPSTLLAVA